MMNEKELRNLLKSQTNDDLIKVRVYQKGRNAHFTVKYFRKADIKSRYVFKSLQYLSFYHGELMFSLV